MGEKACNFFDNLLNKLFWLVQNGHRLLHDYCVIEVIVTFVCLYLLIAQTHLYFDNLEELKEWDIGFFLPFNAALFGLIKECRHSIMSRYDKIHAKEVSDV